MRTVIAYPAAMLAVFVLIGCASLGGGATPLVLEQQETIARQEVVLSRLNANNEEVMDLVAWLMSDFADIRDWQARFEPFTRRMWEIIEENQAWLEEFAD